MKIDKYFHMYSRKDDVLFEEIEKPERKKGIWIHVHPLQSDDSGAYMCSECRTGNWEIDPERYFFCPYCGADMRGKQDDEQRSTNND